MAVVSMANLMPLMSFASFSTSPWWAVSDMCTSPISWPQRHAAAGRPPRAGAKPMPSQLLRLVGRRDMLTLQAGHLDVGLTGRLRDAVSRATRQHERLGGRQVDEVPDADEQRTCAIAGPQNRADPL